MQLYSKALILQDLVLVVVSTMLGLGFLYFPVRSTFLMTTLMTSFIISIVWNRMAPYCLLRQKISSSVSHAACYMCFLSYGAYQMTLTIVGTLCKVINDTWVSQANTPAMNAWLACLRLLVLGNTLL